MGSTNPSPAYFNGNFTGLLTSRGIMNSNGQVNEYDGVWNYLPTGRFEQSTASVQLTTVSLSGGLPTGTATNGAASLAVGTNSSTPIIGASSMQITAASAWAAGQGFSLPAFTVRGADLGKVLTFSFYYQANTGPTALNWSGVLGSQSLMVYIYDVTAAAWVQPTGFLGMNTSSPSGFVSGTFQSSVTVGQQYQIYVLASQASSATCSVSFDGMQICPQIIPTGAVMTDWVSYTPTLVGFGTPTAVSFFSRRVGGSLEVEGVFTAGTTTATQASLTIGYSGANSNVSTSTTAIAQNSIVGEVISGQSSTTYFGGYLYTGTLGNSTIFFGVQSSTQNALSPANGSTVAASTGAVTVRLSVPIQGWSSNVQMSNDTDTRVIIARYKTSSTQSVPISTSTIVNFDSVDYDNSSSVTTGASWSFKAPITGYYNVSGRITYASAAVVTNAQFRLDLYKNGVDFAYLGFYRSEASSGADLPSVGGSTIIQLNAGDTINLQAFQDDGTHTLFGNALGCWVAIQRISGPSVIASTESVRFKAFNTAGTSIANTGDNNVPFATVVYDSHAGWNGTQYKVPVSGKYSVRGTVNYTSATYGVNNQLIASVYRTPVGGSATLDSYGDIAPVMAIVTLPFGSVVDTELQCNAGDLLELRAQNTRSAGATTLNTGAGFNSLVIGRSGN
jgi:hypothetical protein